MNARSSVYTATFRHSNPVPAACRKGDILISGIVTGVDPESGHLPPTLEQQCAFMFGHVRSIVEAGGGKIGDIVKLTVWLRDRSQREPVNREWLKMFPDQNDRPTRQAMEASLDGGKLVQCDFIAVLDNPPAGKQPG
ncbi:RidA family protein [Bradyrhizobium sp. 200]|uniref:RidA family protein n=1 Tax=Bradyrhizobium sp. 200 TaxID=2782665 RepID=UPI001FFF3B5E|nr:RidA family protein [Bradyrhizobium sp. 200]UPJ48402.1 RidA family protein [Bradyrhizobium sp. 200]